MCAFSVGVVGRFWRTSVWGKRECKEKMYMEIVRFGCILSI